MPCAEVAFYQLIGEVLSLHRHLAGDVNRNGIRSIGLQNMPQLSGCFRNGGVHGNGSRWRCAVWPKKGAVQSGGGRDRLVARAAFGAEPPPIGRVCGIPPHPDNFLVFHLHHNAAPDTAIRADRPDFFRAGHAGYAIAASAGAVTLRARISTRPLCSLASHAWIDLDASSRQVPSSRLKCCL